MFYFKKSFAKFGLLAAAAFCLGSTLAQAEEHQNEYGMVLVDIPAGKFAMGCQDDRCQDRELPVHQVQVDAFQIGKYEVTQGEWRAVMGSNPSGFDKCGNNCPVEQVSWEDVQLFIQKLNAKTSGGYRLPSSAEWEYACRAGFKTRFCGGNNASLVGWYDDNSGDTTHRVGGKQANDFGLYDMSGNVREWVEDCCCSKNYKGAPKRGIAWTTGCTDSDHRTTRGGDWYMTARFTRAASFLGNKPSTTYSSIGFRLARNPR